MPLPEGRDLVAGTAQSCEIVQAWRRWENRGGLWGVIRLRAGAIKPYWKWDKLPFPQQVGRISTINSTPLKMNGWIPCPHGGERFRSFSFLFMGDGCRFQAFIFRGNTVKGWWPLFFVAQAKTHCYDVSVRCWFTVVFMDFLVDLACKRCP